MRSWAIRKAVLDHPNERSSHTIATPRGGGIALAISWFIGLIVLFWQNGIPSPLFFALLCGLPVSVIGLIDDMMTITPKIRLLIQLAAATAAIIFLGGMQQLDLGFMMISIPLVLSIAAVVGIVWFTNLFNFLDGIDGYISLEVIFIGLAVYFLFGAALPLLMAAATLGFLLWNWQPAKIFMGDVGSTLLGFSVAVLGIYYQNVNLVSIPVTLILTSVFWFDATVTLFRRMLNKESLHLAHRKHAYQRIVLSGFSHQRTVIWAFVLNLIGMGLVILANKYTDYVCLFLVVDLVLPESTNAQFSAISSAQFSANMSAQFWLNLDA